MLRHGWALVAIALMWAGAHLGLTQHSRTPLLGVAWPPDVYRVRICCLPGTMTGCLCTMLKV